MDCSEQSDPVQALGSMGPPSPAFAASGPSIQVPGHPGYSPYTGPSGFPPNQSLGSTGAFTVPGYTPNHALYNSTRAANARLAYALTVGHVIVVEVRAVHMPPGRIKPMLIGVCFLFPLKFQVEF